MKHETTTASLGAVHFRRGQTKYKAKEQSTRKPSAHWIASEKEIGGRKMPNDTEIFICLKDNLIGKCCWLLALFMFDDDDDEDDGIWLPLR